jgi:LacI family transcriptional regulator, galactose operon repressor
MAGESSASVTSHDVARLAGVSQPTVSRALRDSPKVSAITKERVLRAASALGYVPSDAGRALSSGRTQRIGLLVTDLANQFYAHVIAPMHDQLTALGFQLSLQTESSDTGRVAERLIADGLDGVLLATVTLDSVLPFRLRDRGIPFVYFNRVSPAVDADATTVNPEPGLEEAVEEIVRLGHRRIAGIFGPRNTSTAEQREIALREALDRRGLSIPRQSSFRGPFDFSTGYEGAQQLLQQDPRPTVLVCGNDVVAFGALNAAREMAIGVPEQVSVIGFDNLPPARWPLIQLTTVAFDLDAMARRAAELIVQRIEGGPDASYVQEVFPTHLVRRATLAVAPAEGANH